VNFQQVLQSSQGSAAFAVASITDLSAFAGDLMDLDFGHWPAFSSAMKTSAEIRNPQAALEAKLAELTATFQDRSGLTIEHSADVFDSIRMATDRDVLVQRMNLSAQTLTDVREALARVIQGECGSAKTARKRFPRGG